MNFLKHSFILHSAAYLPFGKFRNYFFFILTLCPTISLNDSFDSYDLFSTKFVPILQLNSALELCVYVGLIIDICITLKESKLYK